jgi:hypothetical protein
MSDTKLETPSDSAVGAVDNGARNRLVIGILMISTFVVILN